jgi:hypothetical protein
MSKAVSQLMSLPVAGFLQRGRSSMALHIADRPKVDEVVLSYHSINAPHLHHTGLYNTPVSDCHIKCCATQKQ